MIDGLAVTRVAGEVTVWALRETVGKMNVYRSHGTAWFLLCLLGCSQTRSVPSAVSTPEVGPAGSSSANSDAAAGAAAPAARAESASAAGVATGTPAAVPTAASLEPPYDLASDLVARKARAKQDLGGRAAWTVVSDVFLLVFPEGGSTMMTDARGREGERIVEARFFDGILQTLVIGLQIGEF